MFTNATVYRISPECNLDLTNFEAALALNEFVECGASQEKSIGWVPPRGQKHGALREVVAGQWIMKLMVETRKVPTSAINRELENRIEALEQQTGRKPGKREKKEMVEDIRLSMLPHAFAKEVATPVWIDPASKLLLIDSASQARTDDVVTCLIRAIEGLVVSLVQTAASPSGSMATWLKTKEAPSGFSVDRDCDLRASDEYANHPLDNEEVQQHIAMGKMPTRLGMTWSDRVSFTLTDAGTLKKLVFLDTVFESDKREVEGDGFDTDVAIATGEFKKLIPDLVEALGGEVAVGISATEAANDSGAANVEDPLFQKACDIVRSSQKASISLVQRHLQIGYNRAARLLELMEKAGLISAMGQNGERKVLKAA